MRLLTSRQRASAVTPEIKEVYDVTRKAPVLRIVLITAFVLVLTVVPGALAGKPNTSGASLSFNPATVVVGQQYQVNGSGFKPNTWVTVGAHDADTTWWNSGVTDGQGNISLTFTATSAGQVYHEADQMGNNDRLRFMTGATLTVNP
jgi:hypothetical protein